MERASRPRSPDRADVRSAPIERWLAVLVVVCCLATLLHEAFFAPRPMPDGVDHLLALYARVAAELPPGDRIGFVSRIADRDTARATAYAAQSALAPRLLDADLGKATIAITTPNAAPAVDDDPRLRGFALVATAP